ncbi:MAG: hypothetical protein RSD49_08035 [Hafnia sp.]
MTQSVTTQQASPAFRAELSLPSSAYNQLPFRGKLRYQWRKQFSREFGRVYLENVLNWTSGRQLLIYGANAEKRRIIFNRLLDRDGLRWKKGGYMFVNMQRAMQVEDALEKLGVECNTIMMRDVIADNFDLSGFSLIPKSVVTIFVADADSAEVKHQAVKKVQSHLHKQLVELFGIELGFSDQLRDGMPVDVMAGKTEFQKNRALIPILYEDMMENDGSEFQFLPQLRNFFTVIYFNDHFFSGDQSVLKRPVDDPLRKQAECFLANSAYLLLDQGDDMRGCTGMMLNVSVEQLAESSLDFPSGEFNYAIDDPYNVAILSNGVYLTVDLKREIKAAA